MIKNEILQNNFSTNSTSTTVMIESHSSLLASDDMKPTTEQLDGSSKQLSKHPIQFTPETLRTHLEPIIHNMVAWEDSYPFRQPVDPVALNILDYPTINKHIMNISTMHNKLLRGEYKNPLQFCDDAWLYTNKPLRVYKMCTKLAKLFVESIDRVVQELGYCCGRQYAYLPQVMLCYGKQSSDTYTFCVKCFNSNESESIFVGDDPTQALVEIPKKLFLLAKNDIQEPEIMIDCIICTRRWHQICALRLDQIWPEGFICNTCIREYNIKRKENRYIAQQLTVTDLSSRLEERVNKFLLDKDCHEGRVTIRVLASSDKICKVKPQLKSFYPNQVVDDYPYRTKAIFAFQEIEGLDVVFFGMYVQEYDERCPTPNTHRAYISYLDTVHFFRPKLYRQDVYHEILIGYLNYAKQHGYMYAHLWACPTSADFDYIFHCHPPEQRFPKLKHLRDWCRKMLDRAIAEHIAIDYKNIMQDCLDNQAHTVLDIPYFDDDLWPIIIEDSIEKLNQE
ncbi:unnamed protein product [Rotaria sp. Silwood2]|nr:unnamed protein product [Rotaria sp. Silwood2]